MTTIKKGYKTDDFSSVLLLSDNATAANEWEKKKGISDMSTTPRTNYQLIETWDYFQLLIQFMYTTEDN